MAFVIELLKCAGIFIAGTICLGVAILVFVVVREAAWVVKYENRKKYEESEEEEE